MKDHANPSVTGDNSTEDWASEDILVIDLKPGAAEPPSKGHVRAFVEDHANPCVTTGKPIDVWPEEDISSDSPGEAEATCGKAPPLEQDTKRVTFGGARPKVSSADESSEEEIRYVGSSEEFSLVKEEIR